MRRIFRRREKLYGWKLLPPLAEAMVGNTEKREKQELRGGKFVLTLPKSAIKLSLELSQKENKFFNASPLIMIFHTASSERREKFVSVFDLPLTGSTSRRGVCVRPTICHR
jgi:hypothetical protein